MDALIITAPGLITNPTAYLPDIDTALRYRVKANDFTIADGPLPGPIVTTRGDGPLVARTWLVNTDYGSGWTLPNFANTGGPNNGKYFAWNGTTSRLQNIGFGAGPLLGTSRTWFWVFKNNKHPASNAPFLAGLVNSANNLYIWLDRVGGLNRIAFQGSFGTLYQTCPTLSADDWTAVIVAQDATRTRVKVGNNPITEIAQPGMTYAGQLVGGGFANAGPQGTLNGGYVDFGEYDRMLNNWDIDGLYIDLCLTYGITA